MNEPLKSDGKYSVFKTEEFEKDVPNAGEAFNHIALDDFVVIRFQDIFAGPGLAAYAHAVQTFLDGVHFLDPKNEIITEYEKERIEELRDFFSALSDRAFEHPLKKVPD